MSIQIELPRGWPAYAFVPEGIVLIVWMIYICAALYFWINVKLVKFRLT